MGKSTHFAELSSLMQGKQKTAAAHSMLHDPAEKRYYYATGPHRSRGLTSV
jgi:hypothetical protein